MTFGNSLAVVLVAAASVTQLFQFGGKVFGGEDLPQGEVRSNVGARVETPLAGAGEALHSSPSEPVLTKCQPCVCPDSDRTEGFFSDPWEATALAGASGLALTVGALIPDIAGAALTERWTQSTLIGRSCSRKPSLLGRTTTYRSAK